MRRLTFWFSIARLHFSWSIAWGRDTEDADIYCEGIWEECPACEGTGTNELEQDCAWCVDSGYPGLVKHDHSEDRP